MAATQTKIPPANTPSLSATLGKRRRIEVNPSQVGEPVLSWAARVGDGTPSRPSMVDEDEHSMVILEKQPVQKSKTRRLVGKKVLADCNVKTVKRQCSVFAGRLDPDTTCESITDFLKAGGIEVNSCYKLPTVSKKTGYVFKSAAFKITFNEDLIEKVFDENVWPVQCDLREWVYTERRRRSVVADRPTGSLINNFGGD